MTYDFRASQVRTNKLIASGSTGTNAEILIYPFSSALNQSGSINTSVFATGSIGQDTFMFVSGAIFSMNSSTRGTTVFGGDVKISGSFQVITSFESYAPITAYSSFSVFGTTNFLGDVSMFASGAANGPFTAFSTSRFVGATTISGVITSVNTASFSGPVTASNALVVTGKLSGSLQTLSNGTPFLKAGPNITIVTESNGAVAISGSAGGTSYTMQSWIDFQRQRTTIYPAELPGDYTIGTRFYTTVSGASCTGYRFAWGGSTDQDLAVTLWSGSVSVASVSVPVSAASPGVFTGSWGASVALDPYRDYYISYRDQSGVNYYAYTSGNDFHFFAGTGTNKAARVLPNLIVGWFYCFAGSNAAPLSAGADNYSSAIEPVITFS